MTEIERTRIAKEKIEAAILKLPGVVAIGVGPKLVNGAPRARWPSKSKPARHPCRRTSDTNRGTRLRAWQSPRSCPWR